MKKKVKTIADCVQAFHFDRFVFKSDKKIREKKLFPALCWDIKYVHMLAEYETQCK